MADSSSYRVRRPEGAESARLAAGVGALLASARAAAHLSRPQLAVKAEVDVGTVTAIETGRSRPSWISLCKIASALHRSDLAAAQRLALALADAAGPSLAGDPRVPAALSRELLVEVLGAAARELGMDLTDTTVREVVAGQLRRVAGERVAPIAAIRAAEVLAIGGAAVDCGQTGEPQVT